MSKAKTKSGAFEQTTYQRAELAALRRMLTLSEGTFSLSLAVCNSPALRDHIIAHIKIEFPSIEVVALNQDTVDVLDLVRRQVHQHNPQAMFIVDIEKALASDARDRVLQALNVSREPLHSSYQCPVVLWMADYVVELLSTQARDLWSWVSHTFEFVSEQRTARAGLEDEYAGDLASARNLDTHEKQFRIAELEQRIADVGEDPKGQVRQHALIWLKELAYLYDFVGNLDEAKHVLRQLLGWAEPDNQKILAGAYASLGHVYQIQGDYGQSLELYEKSQEIAEKLGNRAAISASLLNIGVVHQLRGDYDKALEYYERSREIKQELGDGLGVSNSLHNIGSIYQSRGDYNRALECYEQSRKIKEELGDPAGVSKSLHNIGIIHQEQGEYDKALACYERSRIIDEQLGDRAGVSKSLHHIGRIHQERGDYDKALAYYEQSRMIDEELNYRGDLSVSLLQIGTIHQERGDYDKALECYEQSRKISEEIGDRAGLSASLHQIGIIHQSRGDYDQALEDYERSRRIREDIGDRAGASKSLHQIGIIHQLRRDYDKALPHYEQARRTFEELGDRPSLARCHGQIGTLCAQTGRPGDAFEHFLLALAIFAEIGSPDRFKTTNDLRTLRQTWGAKEFDTAWREQTGEEPPEWVKKEPKKANEEGQASG